jgi:phospholipid/cholesterol/gamma-HCH transport system ATP-binding protein
MIEIIDIKKSFNGKEVLKGISAKFEPTINSLIIGASGTGKSVLLKCIVGLEKPDSGQILYDGRDLVTSPKKVAKEIRRDIGMLFQGGALFDSKTVEENVRFPLDMLDEGMTKEEKQERVNTCLARVGLENANKKFPSEISGGMKKRVGIARAIVMNPKYLFCDEPNSGLDPNTSILIDNLIAEITDEYNITTVVVTHDMNSVMGIGEYVMFMNQGLKVWEGDMDTILESDNEELHEFVYSSQAMLAMQTLHSQTKTNRNKKTSPK